MAGARETPKPAPGVGRVASRSGAPVQMACIAGERRNHGLPLPVLGVALWCLTAGGCSKPDPERVAASSQPAHEEDHPTGEGIAEQEPPKEDSGEGDWEDCEVEPRFSRGPPQTRMWRAGGDMKSYKDKTGRYAHEWRLFDSSTYSDAIGSLWRTPKSRYTYEILSASEHGFFIQTIDENNVIVMELDQSRVEPNELGEMVCCYERTNHMEPRAWWIFLSYVRERMEEYRAARARYAATWKDLDFHWALVDHKGSEARVRPPKGSGASWRPLGSSYEYVIVRAGEKDYEVRSFNDECLDDYVITRADRYPAQLAGPMSGCPSLTERFD